MTDQNNNQTNNQTKNTAKNAPVATHRDGAISSKVWRNVSTEGNTYYSTTFQRTYTNAEGRPAETSSFSRNDLLKVKELAAESYRSIGVMREMDKEQAPVHEHEQPEDLAQQRDAAMSNAAPTQNQGQTHEPVPERG